jgi:hypothetical protein
MGLDERGQLIVQCGIELLNVKEELLQLEIEPPSPALERRMTLLNERKHRLLSRVGELSSGGTRLAPVNCGAESTEDANR